MVRASRGEARSRPYPYPVWNRYGSCLLAGLQPGRPGPVVETTKICLHAAASVGLFGSPRDGGHLY